jgi:hypothetical protein
MPSRSPAQHRLMMAVAHSPSFAAKVGMPQSVGREFVAADQGLLSGAIRKIKKIKKPSRVDRRIVPHSQTHASALDEPAGMEGAYGGGM